MQDEHRELLAAYAHEAWAGWMRYMFERGGSIAEVAVNGEQMECWVMSPSSFVRWQRQMNTPYADLPESEKESDRAEADKIRKLLGLVL